jgi:glycosyltransferase involved in cell wall biosynthesis
MLPLKKVIEPKGMEKLASDSSLPIVLYVSPNGFLGGAEKVVLNAAKAHKLRGKIRPIILFFHDGEAVKVASELGIEHFVLKSKFALSQPLPLLNALKEIRTLVQIFPIKIVHSTMPYAHICMSMALWKYPIKKVWFQHGPVGGTLDKLATFFSVDSLFFNSQYLQRLHHHSFPHTRILKGEAIIPLAVDTKSGQKSFQKSSLVLGAAGRITRGKNFELIIRILKMSECPFTLHIAGSPKSSDDESYFEELKELISSLPSHQKVIFLGHLDSMEKFYEGIDVFVHASLTPEPFGLVMAEAMKAGCLVVGIDGGGSSEFLVSGKTGLTFRDKDELEKRLIEILKNPRNYDYEKLARAGSELIARRYTLDKMGEVLEKAYQAL